MSSLRALVLLVTLLGMAVVCSAQTEWEIDSIPILEPGPPGAFDAGGMWSGTVLFDGTVYHLYYVGFPVANGPFFDGWQIGHATSPDGHVWEKDSSNPVVDLGSPGDWDDGSLSKPAVMFDGEVFHMWYVGGDTSLAMAGYATSPDGSDWTKHAGNPVL